MRPRVLIVDDDKRFLNSLDLVPFENCDIETLDSPLKAIDAWDKLRPHIIVSDVHMPGIHGVDFSLIVRRLMKSDHFIYISANTRKEIEEKYGDIGDYRFFRKPLNQEFFRYLDDLSGDLQNRLGDSAMTELSREIAGRVDLLDKLFGAWKEAEDYEYQCFAGNQYHGLTEKQRIHLGRLRRKLDVLAGFLEIDEETLGEIYAGFASKHLPAAAMIRRDLLQKLPGEVVELEFPFTYHHAFSDETLTFRRLELCNNGDDAWISLDGERLDHAGYFGFIRPGEADPVLSLPEAWGALKGAACYAVRGHIDELIAASRYPDMPEGTELKVTFHQPVLLNNGVVIREFRGRGGFLQVPGQAIDHPDRLTLWPADIPDFTLRGVCEVRVRRAADGHWLMERDGRLCSPPVQLLQAERVAREGAPAWSEYDGRREAVRFALDLAAGRRHWSLAGKDYGPEDFCIGDAV